MRVPPVINAVPAASPPGPSGRVSTTLPVWRAWLTKRYAAEACRTSNALTGNGVNVPSANKLIRAPSIAAMRSGPASIRSNARYRTPGYWSAMAAGSRGSVLPISMKRPPGPNNRKDASVNSPASEFSTTWKPRPPATARNFSSNANVRESPMWSSSKPMARNVSHLPRLAVAKTSAPQCRASCTAAIPTPPVAACTNTRSPAFNPARSDNPYSAVKNTTGTPAAPTSDHSAGTRTTRRSSTTASEPVSPMIPVTASPTVNPLTPGPTSVMTPAPSAPNSAAPGYMPNATNTSRKFTPVAATATRTCAAVSSAGGQGCATRSSSVPASPAASRHSPGGSAKAETSAGASRAAYASPARTTTCGSPHAITVSTSIDPSESSSSTRPGCSACAERTKPHTAAAAGSVTSSPSNATAPRVCTTSTPGPSPASQDCNTPSASCVAAYTKPGRPAPSCEPGSHTTAASALPLGGNDTGDQVGWKRPPPPGRAAPADSCSADTGRRTSSRTVKTGRPAGSASSSDTAPAPTGLSRTRTRDAPAACRHTPCQENGRTAWAWASSIPSACRAASNRTGCMPYPATVTPAACGTATSAKISSPRRHIARRPRNAGP